MPSLATVVLSVVVAGCGGTGGEATPTTAEATTSPPPSFSTELVSKGEVLYQSMCSLCHGVGGGGGVGPALNDGLTTQKYAVLLDEVELLQNGGTGMPAYGLTLEQEEIDALVAYRRSVLDRD